MHSHGDSCVSMGGQWVDSGKHGWTVVGSGKHGETVVGSGDSGLTVVSMGGQR